MVKKVFLLISCLAALSCQKQSLKACQFSNPIEDLGWLEDALKKYDRFPGNLTIEQATYQEQPVFSINIFSSPDAGLGTLYRCDGSIICQFNFTRRGKSGDCGSISKELTRSKMIYEEKR